MDLLDSPGIILGSITAVTWGIWAAMVDVATNYAPSETVMFTATLAGLVVMFGWQRLNGVPALPETSSGKIWTLTAGVLSGSAIILFYTALDYGSVGIVTTIVALYFVVSVLLGVAFLNESLDRYEVSGIICAVIAVVLLTG